MNKEIRRKLIMARTNLILNAPFFGALAVALRLVEDNSQPTAYTDGTIFGYNEHYVMALSMPQTEGLFAHEVMHCANGHCHRRDGRHPFRWNLGCDYSIDPILVAEGFDVPDATVNKDWIGKSAEWIYSVLPPTPPQPKGGAGKNGNGSGPPPPKSQCGCGGLRDAPPDGITPVEWKVIIGQAAQTAKAQGKLPSSLAHLVEELEKPRLDWRATLRRFVQETATADYSWMRPNRRYMSYGLILPSLRSEQMPEVVVAIDTSGSISNQELAAFLGETQSIIDECKPVSTYLMQCDAKVHATTEFFADDILAGIKIHGRGGTAFEPVFEEVDKLGLQPACLIYLTDMYGSFPAVAPEYPTIWVSTTENYEAPFGETIYLSDGGA